MPTPLEPHDPQRLDEYRLTGRLWAGAHHMAYEGHAPDGTRVVARVLHRLQDPAPMSARVAGLRRAAAPHTARILGARLDGPTPYVVSEFVEGPDLFEALMDGPPLAGEALHDLAVRVAEALVAFHGAGVVYGGPCPRDIVFGPGGPCLVGLGLVPGSESPMVVGGAGAIAWSAPEFLHGRPAEPATDVYGWGATVLFAAHGWHFFEVTDLMMVAHQVLNKRPDLSPLPETLRPLVGVALAKDPARRPESALLRAALDPESGPRFPSA